MAFCSNCGSEIKDGEKFCTNCGKAVSTEPRMHNTGNNAEDIVDKKPKKKIKVWKVILGILLILVIGFAAFIYHVLHEDFPKDISREKTTDLDVGGIIFPVSEAYTYVSTNEGGGKSYKTKGSRSYMLFESTSLDIPEGYDVTSKEIEDIIYESIKDNANKMLISAKEVNTENMSIEGMPSWSKAYKGQYEGVDAYMKCFATYNSYSKKLVAVTIATTAKHKDEAMLRYDKMIQSAKINKEILSSAGGVSTDLRELLDSYEAFMDEYIEFMKKYKSNSSDVAGMLGDYTDIMQKYTDFATKISNLNTSNMSPADYAYYMEVTTRIYKKLAEIE